MKNTIEIDRDDLAELLACAYEVLGEMGNEPGVPSPDLVRAARAATAALSAPAQPAATTAQGPTRWQDYPWLPMFFTGPSSSARWFCVSPDGCFEEWSKKPKLTDAGWEGIGFGVRVSYVNLNGTDWRATLREILP